MATAWREWSICQQEAIRKRLTPTQEAVVVRLLLRGWEISNLYHRTLTMCRQRTTWLARCPIGITPNGTIRRGG